MNEDTIVRFSASGRTIPLVSGEVKFIRIFAGDHPQRGRFCSAIRSAGLPLGPPLYVRHSRSATSDPSAEVLRPQGPLLQVRRFSTLGSGQAANGHPSLPTLGLFVVRRNKSSDVAEMAAQCWVCYFLLVHNSGLSCTRSKLSRICNRSFAVKWRLTVLKVYLGRKEAPFFYLQFMAPQLRLLQWWGKAHHH